MFGFFAGVTAGVGVGPGGGSGGVAGGLDVVGCGVIGFDGETLVETLVGGVAVVVVAAAALVVGVGAGSVFLAAGAFDGGGGSGGMVALMAGSGIHIAAHGATYADGLPTSNQNRAYDFAISADGGITANYF